MREIVYVSIGNSDDKLSQADWAEFVIAMSARVAGCAEFQHGVWFSVPHARWQNACWCLEFTSDDSIKEAKEVCAELARQYNQDSIAWAPVPETEFIS